jgi:hypothetical protein
MSRKQRRGIGPPGAKPAFGIAANAANSPAAMFNAAVAHHQTGALIEACTISVSSRSSAVTQRPQ